jgi:hypothetical protein
MLVSQYILEGKPWRVAFAPFLLGARNPWPPGCTSHPVRWPVGRCFAGRLSAVLAFGSGALCRRSGGTPLPAEPCAVRVAHATRASRVHASHPAPHPSGALRAWSPHILCFGSQRLLLGMPPRGNEIAEKASILRAIPCAPGEDAEPDDECERRTDPGWATQENKSMVDFTFPGLVIGKSLLTNMEIIHLNAIIF